MTWDIGKAEHFYKIPQWGLGYFGVSEDGDLFVKPAADSDHKVDLKMLVEELVRRKINTPILIRFLDILKDRIAALTNCFLSAIESNEYQGAYYPIFPIKTNQERDVVTSILEYGKKNGLGLEAGSKAELLIVLALTMEAETPIVCNGYKDSEFVALVAMAYKMGKRVVPVIESLHELNTFIAFHAETGILPDLGIRIKLSTRGGGKWAESGGESSKFGLRIPELQRAVALLKEKGLLSSLLLLHFHVGSQITRISVVKQAVVETMRVYVALCKMGAPMGYLDIGGGLGVDYDGSGSDNNSSTNYQIEEYANDIIYRVKQVCDENHLTHPVIFSESGRFLAAHYSVLVTDIAMTSSTRLKNANPLSPTTDYGPHKEMFDILEILDETNMVESYHDAIQYKNQSLNLFNLGYMSLEERGGVEELFWEIMLRIHRLSKQSGESFLELETLEHQLADIYFANFSIFQSLPDAWAINQVFPLIPIHRLNEEPDRAAVVVDLTCDSDGLIDSYVGSDVKNASTSLHTLKDNERYYVGIFMVGAYQETLGELHNLFGDTHAVQILITGKNRYRVQGVIKGDTIHKVIGYMSYDTQELLHQMRDQTESAVELGHLSLDEAANFILSYEESLFDYTYFRDRHVRKS